MRRVIVSDTSNIPHNAVGSYLGLYISDESSTFDQKLSAISKTSRVLVGWSEKESTGLPLRLHVRRVQEWAFHAKVLCRPRGSKGSLFRYDLISC